MRIVPRYRLDEWRRRFEKKPKFFLPSITHYVSNSIVIAYTDYTVLRVVDTAKFVKHETVYTYVTGIDECTKIHKYTDTHVS